MNLLRSSQDSNLFLLALAPILTILIALIDWRIQPNISLGLLYVFPILLAALSYGHYPAAALALACAVLREAFGPFQWDEDAPARMILVSLAFVGTGLFVSEVSRNRKAALQNVAHLKAEVELRRQAEEELRVVIDTSPAGILIIEPNGCIATANEAAHRLLTADESLSGRPVSRFLPALARILEGTEGARVFQNMLEEHARRSNGEHFLAQVWYSSFAGPRGWRCAAIVLDASDDFRGREDAGLRTLMWTSRILIGAVSHEVRNLCQAAATAYLNLGRRPGVARDPDFQSLGIVVEGLRKIAGSDLARASRTNVVHAVDLNAALKEWRILIEPDLKDSGIELLWDVPDHLPDVRGEHDAMLHVLMNLSRNSMRALEGSAIKQFKVEAEWHDEIVHVKVCDSGPGVPETIELFRPFTPQSQGTGLGLYVARAILRAAGGDLRHEKRTQGSCFVLELVAQPGNNM